MEQPKFGTCIVNNYDGKYLPRTLSQDEISIPAIVSYPYTWVNVEEEGDYGSGDGEIFCIYINGGWHQAQSIDFDFND